LHTPAAIALLVLAVTGATLFFAWSIARNRRKPTQPRMGDSIEMTCTVCRRDMVFTSSALEPLSATEMGLVVQVRPELVGRRLADFNCPYCDATHCFTVDRREPEWVGVNFYQPTDVLAHCFECHRPLKRLPGGTGGVTEQVEDTSGLDGDAGLKCPRCHSVCCVACCRRASRGRTQNGVMLCPRCGRRPVNLLYYP
jgi:hypothetical protein